MKKYKYLISLAECVARIYIFMRHILLRDLFEMNQKGWSVSNKGRWRKRRSLKIFQGQQRFWGSNIWSVQMYYIECKPWEGFLCKAYHSFINCIMHALALFAFFFFFLITSALACHILLSLLPPLFLFLFFFFLSSTLPPSLPISLLVLPLELSCHIARNPRPHQKAYYHSKWHPVKF